MTTGCVEIEYSSVQGASALPNMDRASTTAHATRGAVLACVADGMGCSDRGGAAAEIACDVVGRAFARNRHGEWAAVLRAAALAAHAAIAAELGGRPGVWVGATLVAAVVEEGRLTVAHVGDSRASLYRGLFVRRLTRDHLAVVDDGVPENLAKRHPGGSVLSRVLGCGRLTPASVDVAEVALLPGDLVALQSDGIGEALDERALGRILRAAPDGRTAAARATAAAVRGGSGDHCTLLSMFLHPA